MKSNMSIEVEFLAGTGIEDAIKEAKEKAEQFGVAYIQFKFNGVRCSISRNANVADLAVVYRECVSGNKNGNLNFVCG